MQLDLRDDLPLVQRLALSYAPASSREAVLTLLALDARLAAILRNRSEAMIAQIKLAWWRERLAEDPAHWPSGEPLLARLALWPGLDGGAANDKPQDNAWSHLKGLGGLVDGWEVLLADQLGEAEMQEFALGRSQAWESLALIFAPDHADLVARAAKQWALADLAMHLDHTEESALAKELALKEDWSLGRLPRSVRPLAVLHGLSRHALDGNSTKLLNNYASGMLALRIGMFGV